MIQLKDIHIRLSHNRPMDTRDPDRINTFERVDEIKGTIRLGGDLNATQRRRLLEIAGRCWMHRTLTNGVSIRFHLDDT